MNFPHKTGLYIGLMSGTSIDAIDAVLVRICTTESSKIEVLASHSTPIPTDVRTQILTLCTPGHNEIAMSARLDRVLGKLFGLCAADLCVINKLDTSDIIAIGSHGQTIRHKPEDTPSFTVQIADPNTISEITGITTVADFRRRDIAANGQGAPLAPAFHKFAFSSPEYHRAIVNLGGIANISILPSTTTPFPDNYAGYDIGPANMLLDYWINVHKGMPFDNNGNWAASGKTDQALLHCMLGDPFFTRPPPKSTGREHFNQDWLDDKLKDFPDILHEDIQSTLLDLTIEAIALAIKNTYEIKVGELYLCGGGAKNTELIRRLNARLSNVRVQTTSVLGIDPQLVEGAAFAWLAYQTLHHLPGNSPEVTGAKGDRVLGGIYFA